MMKIVRSAAIVATVLLFGGMATVVRLQQKQESSVDTSEEEQLAHRQLRSDPRSVINKMSKQDEEAILIEQQNPYYQPVHDGHQQQLQLAQGEEQLFFNQAGAEPQEPAHPQEPVPPPPEEQKQQEVQLQQQQQTALEPMPYNLPERAREWCMPPEHPELPIHGCDSYETINQIIMGGGLTNALKIVLLGAIRSYEEGRCFFINESYSHLVKRNDPNNSIGPSFLNRYFEPIGLPQDHPQVLLAQKEGRIANKDFLDEIWTDPMRRVRGSTNTLQSIHYHDIEGHILKRIMLKRLWRPLPQVRDTTCRSLEQHGLHQDYLAFGVRRGDKSTEPHTKFSTTEEYIEEAEHVIKHNFHGKVPIIFVATDDCGVMDELRTMRPDWHFESQCDNVDQSGFVIGDMLDWTPEETDAHFMKFFVELYALVAAKVVIGVSYTNVAWWAYFMRGDNWTEYHMIDVRGREKQIFDTW